MSPAEKERVAHNTVTPGEPYGLDERAYSNYLMRRWCGYASEADDGPDAYDYDMAKILIAGTNADPALQPLLQWKAKPWWRRMWEPRPVIDIHQNWNG